MKRTKNVIAVVIFFFTTFSFAQSLDYSGANLFDISSPNFVDAIALISHEISPTGMEFGDNGTKFYTVGAGGDFVVQHNLSVAYDLSTISGIDGFISVEGQDTNPHDVTFNDTGSKMYITGDTGNDITEYDLSINWDVSTAVFTDVFDFEAAVFAFDSSNANRPQGIAFNNNGSKLYVVDRNRDRVYEFDLTVNYDVSTAAVGGVINELNINAFEGNPRGITFNNDGSEMYITGQNGDEVNIFTFSSGNQFDLSAASHSSVFPIDTEEILPQDILFNNTGSKFYIIGSDGDDVNEYTLSNNFDFTSTVSLINNYKVLSFDRSPQDVLFNNDGTKMYVVGDNFNKIAQYTLPVAYDISSAIFEDSYSVSDEESNPRGMAFNNTGLIFYIVGTSGDEVNEYSLSTPYDLTSTVTHLAAFDISADDNNATSITFNDVGTLLFVLGNDTVNTALNDVIVYTLPSPFDLTGITSGPTGRFSVSSEDNAPLGMTFSNDGLSLFVVGNQRDDINEYALASAYDVLTVAPTFVQNISIAAQDVIPSGIVFNNSGSKFFISGNQGDSIYEYATTGIFRETPNDGSIDTVTSPLVITLNGDTFADTDGDNLLDEGTEFIIANLPEGLTPIFTLSNGDTVLTLTFTGKADSHLNSDEAAANLEFTFTDAAFTSSNAVDVDFAVGYTDFLTFDFIECTDNEIVYNGSWVGGNNGGVPDDSATDLLLGIRIQEDITITANTNCDCLHVESGQTLTIADGVELTVTNALELEGDLRLLGSSQLRQTHTGIRNVSGNGNLYKDVRGTLTNVYQSGYWGSPVTTDGKTYSLAGVFKDGTTQLTATNTPLDIQFTPGLDGDDTTVPITISNRWIAKFTNSSDFTVNIDENSSFTPTEGFNKKSTGNSLGQNYTFLGTPNDGEYTTEIDAFDAATGTYSLLGNPYPSPINADTFILDNATTAGSIIGTLYFYESGPDTSHIRAQYLGGYATRVIGMGVSASEIGAGAKIPGQNIAVGQGFFVQASDTGGTITFNNNLRVFDVTDTNTVFFGKTNLDKKVEEFPILRIGFEFLLENETFHRQLAIGFRGLTNKFENGFDAVMWDYKPTDIALKVEDSQAPFVITGIEDFNIDLQIPITLKSDLDRAVTFKIDESNLDADTYLYDSFTETYHLLNNKDVKINIASGTFDDRFFITFKSETLSLTKDILDKSTIYNLNELLTVKVFKDAIETVEIFNAIGQKIKYNTTRESLKEKIIATNNFKTGIYFVKVKTGKNIISKKIIIE
ncbi:beta-propeller fold lactonase family protein [uncultured Polaribacter sp.]|uniref:beta-propeller fold lactonase family protein n=1 Tax=uncultured Polaribacter sp. TaxID=174711 RepID=UPI0026210ED0|nr:beta-propeller fold lactonase family protein [uncultured Polaribacter sp.]